LKFHHNLVDNFNDDGLYLTCDMPAGNDIHIYQNYLARSLSMLAFSGSGKDQKNKAAWIYRNLFDLRPGINGPAGLVDARTCGDHGSPVWLPMHIYHNTLLLPNTPWRNYYGGELARSVGTSTRSLFNNIFYYARGTPGFAFDPAADQVADGNLHWSPELQNVNPAEFLKKARTPLRKQVNWFEESKKLYPAGWTAHDVVADPRFTRLNEKNTETFDITLQEKSPAIDAGVHIPKTWPDPLREQERQRPDLGALPAGVTPWFIGIDGRYTLSGVLRLKRE
jgi:hypothetical protein